MGGVTVGVAFRKPATDGMSLKQPGRPVPSIGRDSNRDARRGVWPIVATTRAARGEPAGDALGASTKSPPASRAVETYLQGEDRAREKRAAAWPKTRTRCNPSSSSTH
jgi:hypothetical protein